MSNTASPTASSSQWLRQYQVKILGYCSDSCFAMPNLPPTLAPSLANATKCFLKYASSKPCDSRHFNRYCSIRRVQKFNQSRNMKCGSQFLSVWYLRYTICVVVDPRLVNLSMRIEILPSMAWIFWQGIFSHLWNNMISYLRNAVTEVQINSSVKPILML